MKVVAQALRQLFGQLAGGLHRGRQSFFPRLALTHGKSRGD
jgi:hypothetical protein